MSLHSKDVIKKCTVRITLRLRNNQDTRKKPTMRRESTLSTISGDSNLSMRSEDYEANVPDINDAEAICMARNALKHYSNKFKLNIHAVEQYNAEKARSASTDSRGSSSRLRSEESSKCSRYSSCLGTTVNTCSPLSMDSYEANERDFEGKEKDIPNHSEHGKKTKKSKKLNNPGLR
ncbi:unnamed protein product [Bursaphelenchus xylophilus]|uniref:(pine wood nematode) hypothetical protein n=1 Tax=Bursaphelenchus xylophilus TaxID=6326 RepID=A0A1I7RPX9_BURXY|nr:unnamed protein product [Bursaphelenchus xylophilus]CAG9096800.1 unnamed protein product [Bursaphelenchus xylophilus]